VLRITQIAADTQTDYTPILFAWPSEARATAYAADKDAATFSRDHLADLLSSLASNPRIGRVAVVAHSMGGWLTMETLRQLRLAGKNSVLNRLRVVLASPDIDVDVFRQQIAVLGPMEHPMTILVASDDRALAISSRLAASRPRVGALNVNDPRVVEAAQKAHVRIIDISALDTSDAFRHDRHVRLAALYPQMESASTTADQSGAFVLDAIGTTLNPLGIALAAPAGR
jgi:esterase/lipase superfamily enzyme